MPLFSRHHTLANLGILQILDLITVDVSSISKYIKLLHYGSSVDYEIGARCDLPIYWQWNLQRVRGSHETP